MIFMRMCAKSTVAATSASQSLKTGRRTKVMPLRTDIEELPYLNLTSMIDVLLVLVMFFLVSSRFTESEEAQRQRIDVELPTASPIGAMSRLPDPLVIRVDRFGKVALKNEVLSLELLQTKLNEAKKAYAEQSVLISADRKGLYQSVVDVLDACRLCGISHLSLSYEPKAPSMQ